MALTPLVGSSPACAATPSTVIWNRPTPLRAVLIAPSALASNTRAARVPAASASMLRDSSMTGREAGLPISSSPLSTRRIGGRGRPASASARSAHTACTRPDFMSNTPGPVTVSPSTVNGHSARVPLGHTVS